jgi:hypothetical protein
MVPTVPEAEPRVRSNPGNPISNYSRDVLVLTTEPLPLPGRTTTGAGLRAFGLAAGLRSRGFKVTIASAAAGEAEDNSCFEGMQVCHFRRGELNPLLQKASPEVIVLQHWGLARDLPEVTVPLAIDLAGPHLLERAYWGSNRLDADLTEKLAALRRADFVTVSGVYQRHYFYPFLMMAGFDIRKEHIPVIPFSVPPIVPEASPTQREPLSFVYGGAFLAWQDPAESIRWLLEEMHMAGRGKLYFHGGPHPVLDASGGRFSALLETLRQDPFAEVIGYLPYDELMARYQRYSVALDLMAFNPERELAFTTRTMFYLYCGLPVIYNSYSELSQVIREKKCGWTIAEDDEQAFRTVVRNILNGKADIKTPAENAKTAAREFDWQKTIEPLAQFCASPCIRSGKNGQLVRHEAMLRENETLRLECAQLQQDLDSIRGKFLFRLHSRFASAGIWMAPFVYALTFPIALYLYLRFRYSQNRR